MYAGVSPALELDALAVSVALVDAAKTLFSEADFADAGGVCRSRL
jgi:hypothetical protein